MTVRTDAVSRPTAVLRRRRRAGLRDADQAPARRRVPSVFSSLLLLGAAGLMTTLGIFLTTQLVGPPTSGQRPGANAPAIIRQAPPATETATPAPTSPPTPLPTARVYLLPTPSPESWCDRILGWSSFTDSVCHPFGG